MDDFEELENILHEHFGTAEAATGNDINYQDLITAEDLPDDDDDNGDMLWFDQMERIRLFTDTYSSLSDDDEDSTDPYLSVDSGKAALISRLEKGCPCSRNCLNKFDVEAVYDHVLTVQEMGKDEQEMYIMGTLQKLGIDPNVSRYGDRKRTRYDYRFNGVSICRDAFHVVYDIGEFRLKRLLKHLNENGPVARQHGNKNKKPKHALQLDDVQKVVNFITNTADELGLPQPAAPRGRDGTAPIYLPASHTKRTLHSNYIASCNEEDLRKVKYSTFTNIWRSCCSHIKISSPKDDVCSTCETLRKNVIDARSEQEKLETCAKLQEHISKAQKERSVYKHWIDQAKSNMDGFVILEEPNAPCSVDLPNMHYTFDFAQNVFLPHHARQMGPLYFVSSRKVQIFGVRVDGLPRQLNFLIDEDDTMGQDGKEIHGPNAVISMLDHVLNINSYGERECGLHADNCGGQNKNRYVLAYFAWRVMVGLHERITYMMQVPGHTRCIIDSGFAHIKRLYRRTDADTLAHLERIVTDSAETNQAIMYKTDNGDHGWAWRDWKTFLGHDFKALRGIQSYRHFLFDHNKPGFVIAKKEADSPEIAICLLKDPHLRFPDANRPQEVPAAGLSRDRATYLYRNVRPYVRHEHQDSTCPEPGHEE